MPYIRSPLSSDSMFAIFCVHIRRRREADLCRIGSCLAKHRSMLCRNDVQLRCQWTQRLMKHQVERMSSLASGVEAFSSCGSTCFFSLAFLSCGILHTVWHDRSWVDGIGRVHLDLIT
mmetsp:Transcript_96284/g.150541  ORF Transcript_96284/g.150541 Transcript_96284/m.150541 type:complete len:118 (+) Transcript_96284:625-978(+)